MDSLLHIGQWHQVSHDSYVTMNKKATDVFNFENTFNEPLNFESFHCKYCANVIKETTYHQSSMRFDFSRKFTTLAVQARTNKYPG